LILGVPRIGRVTPDQLRAAVKVVGNEAAKVEAHFKATNSK
jgi:hypothetical protein